MESGGLEEKIHEVAVWEGCEVCPFLCGLVMFVTEREINKPLLHSS